jgi:hypothetical protein
MKINKILNFLGPKPQTSFFFSPSTGDTKISCSRLHITGSNGPCVVRFKKTHTDNVLFE